MAITRAKEVERPTLIVVAFAIALPLAIIFNDAPWYYWLIAGLSWTVLGKWVYDTLTYSPFKN